MGSMSSLRSTAFGLISIHHLCPFGYVLTDKLRIHTMQLTNHMKLNKKETQIVITSNLHRRESNIITGGKWRNGPGRKRGVGGKKGGQDQVWEGTGRNAEGQKIE